MSTAYLVIRSGVPSRAVVLHPGTLVAGRSPDSGFCISHVEISRQHCRFAWDGNTCTVQDLGSVRGTTVNHQKIEAVTTLNPGDRVGIGPAIVEFGVGEPPQIQAQPEAAEVAGARMLVRGAPSDRIELSGPVVIGRDPQGDVVLADPGVSRRHAEVKQLPNGGFIVADLNSTGGSFVNGHRFDEHELTVGDRLQVGPFCFQFDGQALFRVANAAGGSLRVSSLTFRVGERIIINDVTITIPPSRFVGIIGPSGAGKSSVLHATAGLRAPTRGTVLADGRNIYASGERASLGFVPQDDIVHPELTVYQALRLSAKLRLQRGTPSHEIDKLIHQTLDQLRLKERANVGISRLSGGQRKRVSVGVELLAKPSILFLDEPTSGLDPATEFQLMELLRDLADTGCTIICTTHVMENAYLMDQLIVLVGGCLAFQGSPQEARTYFEVPKLTALYDQLDSHQPMEWKRKFEENREAHPHEEPPDQPTTRNKKVRRAFALPILLLRQWTILKSDWRNFLILLGQPLIIAGLVCWVSNERALLLFFAYLATLWFGCSNAAQEIVKEIAIYQRERLVGVGGHAYLLSKFFFLTTITFLQSLIIYGCILWFEGSRDGNVMWQVAALAGTSISAVGIGSAISAMSRSVMQAVMIVPLILIPQIIFSGYTVPVSDMEPNVKRVSRMMPTFSAQVMMDTSFLWKKELAGDLISDHGQSYRNLDPDREFGTGDIYTKARPAWLALIGHALWAIGTYIAAWIALKLKERRS